MDAADVSHVTLGCEQQDNLPLLLLKDDATAYVLAMEILRMSHISSKKIAFKFIFTYSIYE